MITRDKPLAWLHEQLKSPPLSQAARLEAGYLIRRLQRGEKLTLPQSRPMPAIGPHCHELRIPDATATWRLVYRIDPDAIVLVEFFAKKTATTPESVIRLCRSRLRHYDNEG